MPAICTIRLAIAAIHTRQVKMCELPTNLVRNLKNGGVPFGLLTCRQVGEISRDFAKYLTTGVLSRYKEKSIHSELLLSFDSQWLEGHVVHNAVLRLAQARLVQDNAIRGVCINLAQSHSKHPFHRRLGARPFGTATQDCEVEDLESKKQVTLCEYKLQPPAQS